MVVLRKRDEGPRAIISLRETVTRGRRQLAQGQIVKADGTGLKKLASRNGYRGVIDYLDVYDFHDGSSDLPVWAPDSKSVFYTAKVGSNVELFRVTLDCKSERLTETPAGSMHYHPAVSPARFPQLVKAAKNLPLKNVIRIHHRR